ncbi:Inner membrane ABC transporter permease protein YcjP [Candidatus Izimaplasma bacterium HR1]|jgi:multiple sugar transport system permease protein|uniref:carbohydrate ABC transporter permease n=1 Tax=Candidatus Izimoplasma sp. HR1 TaxID=1541959 RepID=UPI0004F8988D|nr:Inner membrane ABC transporter permease protein YcjP [Candidatus Izimaplasma bacterium HR1]
MEKTGKFFKDFKLNWPHYRARILGSGNRKGILYYFLVYFLSITFAFVFLYPIFYMFMISLMSNTDLVDSTIMWIPSRVFFDNYLYAWRGLGLDITFVKGTFGVLNAVDESTGLAVYTLTEKLQHIETFKFVLVCLLPVFATYLGRLYTEDKGKLFGTSIFLTVILLFLPKSLTDTLFVSGTTTFVTVISSALIGYGLARFKFKLKGFLFVMLLLIYILPKTLLFIPRALMYNEIGIKGTMFALWVPAFFGSGIQATFFILIFYQFFSMMPGQIEESAYLDGANSFKIFVRIAIPMATPAFVIAFVYGFAVNWNETFLTSAYLNAQIDTIPMFLRQLQSTWNSVADFNTSGSNVNVDYTEAKSFAGTILSILPLAIMYGFIQRYFIESIDKSGIAGE